MLNIYNDLLPFRQEAAHAVINFYSLNGTGVGGRFVTLETGNQDPAESSAVLAGSTPGFAYEGVTNQRWETPRKVRFAASGDTRFSVLGLSLNGTVEYDENGNKVLFNKYVQDEKQIVPSGYTIPIGTDGVYTLKSSAYNNTPIPGYVGVIDGTAGKVSFFDPSTAIAGAYIASGRAVCKVLSTSGSAFGGYAQIKLTLG
jgi:hypothetical protein